MAALRDLLEMRTAAPADFRADGAVVLVSSDLGGTSQLYLAKVGGAGGLVRVTDEEEPVAGFFLPGSDRVLLQMDERGDEIEQLYVLDREGERGREPLVVEPGFFHRTPSVSRDGKALAYTTNRRNGVDWDVVVRDLGSGGERVVYADGGWCQVAGLSPDGSLLAVLKLTQRSGDNDLYLVDVATGESLCAVPHDDASEVGPPAWLPDGQTFFFATSIGRDSRGIALYDLAERTWAYVIEERWDLNCAIDDAGRTLFVDWNIDGYARLELRDPDTLDVRREVELPGRGVVGAMTPWTEADLPTSSRRRSWPVMSGSAIQRPAPASGSPSAPARSQKPTLSSRNFTASSRSTASRCQCSSTTRREETRRRW